MTVCGNVTTNNNGKKTVQFKNNGKKCANVTTTNGMVTVKFTTKSTNVIKPKNSKNSNIKAEKPITLKFPSNIDEFIRDCIFTIKELNKFIIKKYDNEKYLSHNGKFKKFDSYYSKKSFDEKNLSNAYKCLFSWLIEQKTDTLNYNTLPLEKPNIFSINFKMNIKIKENCNTNFTWDKTNWSLLLSKWHLLVSTFTPEIKEYNYVIRYMIDAFYYIIYYKSKSYNYNIVYNHEYYITKKSSDRPALVSAGLHD